MNRNQREAQKLQRLIDRAGLNQSSAARALGLSLRKMQYQVSGEVEVQRSVLLALRYTPAKWLRRLSRVRQ